MTVIDVDTGEVLSQVPAIATPGTPTTPELIAHQCRSVDIWSEHCDSIPDLNEAAGKLAAIGEYLSRIDSEGRALVAASRLRLERRIGELLGPAKHGGDRKSDQVDHGSLDPLTPKQRSQFRKMADHPDVVDAVIDESDDASPASRRRVLDEIGKAKHTPPPPETDAEREARERAEGIRRSVERVRQGLRYWDQLFHLADNVQRDAILAELTDVERARLTDIEEVIHG